METATLQAPWGMLLMMMTTMITDISAVCKLLKCFVQRPGEFSPAAVSMAVGSAIRTEFKLAVLMFKV